MIHEDSEVRFAGRGLRDQFRAAAVYTENLFVKFVDGVDREQCEEVLGKAGLSVKRPLTYAVNAFFVGAEEGIGREVFARADELLARNDVELCHPELVREISWNRAFSEQWHLEATDVNGTHVDAHANVVAAWEASQGEGVVVAVIDDGVDIDHAEFSAQDKLRRAALADVPAVRRPAPERR